jgi:hypothetical protein
MLARLELNPWLNSLYITPTHAVLTVTKVEDKQLAWLLLLLYLIWLFSLVLTTRFDLSMWNASSVEQHERALEQNEERSMAFLTLARYLIQLFVSYVKARAGRASSAIASPKLRECHQTAASEKNWIFVALQRDRFQSQSIVTPVSNSFQFETSLVYLSYLIARSNVVRHADGRSAQKALNNVYLSRLNIVSMIWLEQLLHLPLRTTPTRSFDCFTASFTLTRCRVQLLAQTSQNG